MIYLDYNSTSPARAQIIEIMNKACAQPSNPSSIHALGRAARGLVEKARAQILSVAGGDAKEYEVIFTSCGTEANNMIIQSGLKASGRIFISSVEHASIIEFKGRFPDQVSLINVDGCGRIDTQHLEHMLKSSGKCNILISVMLANNESGVIQRLEKIAQIAKKYGALVHSDAVQAPGRTDIKIGEWGIDFLSLSAHKFGGPLGAGALIKKKSAKIHPHIIGGGQEQNYRAGTQNTPAIAGMGLAAEIAMRDLTKNASHMRSLRDFLEAQLKEIFPHLIFAGSDAQRLCNTSLICGFGKPSEILLAALDIKGVAVGSGAACSSGKISQSHVLKAMNLPQEHVESAIRVSVGTDTTKNEIDKFITTLKTILS